MLKIAKHKYPTHDFILEDITKMQSYKFRFGASLFGSISYVHPLLIKSIFEKLDFFYFMFYKDNYTPITHIKLGIDMTYYEFSDYQVPIDCTIKEVGNYIVVSNLPNA